MKHESYANRTVVDLTRVLREKRQALREVHWKSAGSRAANLKATAALRKEIARILTALESASRA